MSFLDKLLEMSAEKIEERNGGKAVEKVNEEKIEEIVESFIVEDAFLESNEGLVIFHSAPYRTKIAVNHFITEENAHEAIMYDETMHSYSPKQMEYHNIHLVSFGQPSDGDLFAEKNMKFMLMGTYDDGGYRALAICDFFEIPKYAQKFGDEISKIGTILASTDESIVDSSDAHAFNDAHINKLISVSRDLIKKELKEDYPKPVLPVVNYKLNGKYLNIKFKYKNYFE